MQKVKALITRQLFNHIHKNTHTPHNHNHNHTPNQPASQPTSQPSASRATLPPRAGQPANPASLANLPAQPTCQPSPGQPACKPACLPRQRVCTVFLWSKNHVLGPSRGGLRPGFSLASKIFVQMLVFRAQETLLLAQAGSLAVPR